MSVEEEDPADPGAEPGPRSAQGAAAGAGSEEFPAAVRNVLELRLLRISADARRLLACGACFFGPFSLEIAASAADLLETGARSALQESLDAQLVRRRRDAAEYELTHALVREFLYAELNPSRRLRLHRRIAEAMERAHGERPERAWAIAQQYQRSAPLAGAERGVRYCLIAAERAARLAAHGETAQHLAAACALLPAAAPERPRLLARLGLARVWNSQIESALPVLAEAGHRLAEVEGDAAAADYLADAADALWAVAYELRAADTAAQGLRHIGARRDRVWARLMAHHRYLGHHPEAPDGLGLYLRFPEEREISRILLAEGGESALPQGHYLSFDSRADVLQRAAHLPIPVYAVFRAGEYRSSLPAYREQAELALRQGRMLSGVQLLVAVAVIESALGDFAEADATLARATELSAAIEARLAVPLVLAQGACLVLARGAPLESLERQGEPFLAALSSALGWWTQPPRAAFALVFSLLGRRDDARRMLRSTRTAVQHGPGWAPHFTYLIHCVCEAFWNLEQVPDFPVEGPLTEKTLRPDFRYPHTDARLSLARLCALEGRFEEALHWFDAARRVLQEQGARPLRAVGDFDEALMYARRGAAGDRLRARSRLDAAAAQFESIGMLGWSQRAAALAVGL